MNGEEERDQQNEGVARSASGSSLTEWMSPPFFRPFGASSLRACHPRLSPWAAFFRRFAAGILGRSSAWTCFGHWNSAGRIRTAAARLPYLSFAAGLRPELRRCFIVR